VETPVFRDITSSVGLHHSMELLPIKNSYNCDTKLPCHHGWLAWLRSKLTVSLGIVMSKVLNILCGRKFYVEPMNFEGMIITCFLVIALFLLAGNRHSIFCRCPEKEKKAILLILSTQINSNIQVKLQCPLAIILWTSMCRCS
jgi:hypothetical protein